jgi:hypothetical protein
LKSASKELSSKWAAHVESYEYPNSRKNLYRFHELLAYLLDLQYLTLLLQVMSPAFKIASMAGRSPRA